MTRVLATGSRARWKVAGILNRLPGMCWANLVSWVLYSKPLRETRQDWACRQDAASCGTCYCGKIDPAGATKREAVLPQVTQPDPWDSSSEVSS